LIEEIELSFRLERAYIVEDKYSQCDGHVALAGPRVRGANKHGKGGDGCCRRSILDAHLTVRT
jgi:hypothetical protein